MYINNYTYKYVARATTFFEAAWVAVKTSMELPGSWGPELSGGTLGAQAIVIFADHRCGFCDRPDGA